jgi:hypothetical protein
MHYPLSIKNIQPNPAKYVAENAEYFVRRLFEFLEWHDHSRRRPKIETLLQTINTDQRLLNVSRD